MDYYWTALLGAAIAQDIPVEGSAGVFLKTGNTLLSSAMTMTGITVSSGSAQYIYKKGTAAECNILLVGSQLISEGGSAVSCIISSGGIQYVSSGGSAVNNTYDGRFFCYNGGTVTGASIFHGGANSQCIVSSGGTAENVVFGATDGQIRGVLNNYGVLDNATGYAGGVLRVERAGASAYNITLQSAGGPYTSGGYGALMFLTNGAYCSGVTVYSKAYISAVHADTVLEDLTLAEGGYSIQVYSSAYVSNVKMLRSDTAINIQATASAQHIVNSGGNVIVRGSANDVQLLAPKTTCTVSSGATVDTFIVSSGGTLYVSSSGVVTSGIVELGGALNVYPYATISSSVVSRNPGNIIASSGAVWDDVTLVGRGSAVTDLTSLTVSPEATVNKLTAGMATRIYINSGTSIDSLTLRKDADGYGFGTLYLSAGGSATNIDCQGVLYIYGPASGASLSVLSSFRSVVYSGGILVDATVNSPVGLEIRASGVVQNISVNSGGTTFVSSGGLAVDVVLESGGVISGVNSGLISNIVISKGGKAWLGMYDNVNVESGGSIYARMSTTNLTLNSAAFAYTAGYLSNVTLAAGSIFIENAGTVASTVVVSGGKLQLQSSAALVGGTVLSGGSLLITVAASASNCILSSGANATITSSSLAIDTTVAGGGTLIINPTASASGLLLFSNGGLTVSSTGSALAVVSYTSAVVTSKPDAYIEYLTPTDLSSGVFIKQGATVLSSAWDMTGVTIESGQSQELYQYGLAASTIISSGGTQIVSSGGTADSTTVSDCTDYDAVYAANGGTLTNLTMVNGSAGGIYANISNVLLQGTITNNGYDARLVTTSSIVSGVTVSSGGVFAASATSAYNIVVFSRGYFSPNQMSYVSHVECRGGVISCYAPVDDIVIASNGQISLVGSTCYVGSITVESPTSGLVMLLSGVPFNNRAVDCAFNIYTPVSGFTVLSGCTTQILTSGILNDSFIESKGWCRIYDNGSALGVVVSSGGSLTVSSGGTALSVTSETGAVITVLDGGYIEYVTS